MKMPAVPRARMKRPGFRFLWTTNYWNGPLTGACLLNGNRYWFNCCQDTGRYRLYLLYALTPEQWAEVEYRHDLFRKHVGEHCDYDETGCRPAARVQPRPRWAGFYETVKARAPIHPADHQVVFWAGTRY